MMEIQRHIPRISEVLYLGMCIKIGTPTQIKIRRDVADTTEKIYNTVTEGLRSMKSGSKREGFRLNTSDLDIMWWNDNYIVICDLSQVPPYHPSQILILMECHDTPPGFANLRLLTLTNSAAIRSSSIIMNDQVYISSSLYRQTIHNFQEHKPFLSEKIHGPCISGTIMGTFEYDHVYCFLCKHWPPTAYHWIDRCKRQGWPSPQLLQDIISNGCHLVAIGSGRSASSQECETDWRMSFSGAECKLVYSMNYTQFLCYGILKIFLKEVLNVGFKDPLLCSYFVKASLFWKIQENTISVWCSKNILHCVWTCFKYLCQCVYRGEFPNFFIPQNNMFINKVHGAAQKKMFLKLLNLYNMGFSCLLQSPSLNQILTIAIINPHLQVISTDETNIISEVELDGELFREICICTGFFTCRNFLNNIDDLYKTIPSGSQNHTATLHVTRNWSLIHHAFCLDKSRENGAYAKNNCRPLDMLISAAESGFISDTLYVAIYLYNKSRYSEALYYIERTQQKLSQPYVFHISTWNVNMERYMEAVGGKSFIDKIRTALSDFIKIDELCYIDELKLEVCVNKQSCIGILYVPPLVMAHMLSFLCHHHLGDRLRSRQSLEDLQTLLHYDDGQYISPKCRDISWQMLGVCEQLHGDKERALYSYQQSVHVEIPSHQIHTASLIRTQNIQKQNNYL